MSYENTLTELIKELKDLKQEQEKVLKCFEMEKPIFAQDGDKKKVLRIPEIAFITTNSKGLDIYTTDGKKHFNFSSISEVAESFKDDSRLMKTHKSYIVNLDQVDSVRVDSGRELTFKGLSPELTAKVTSDYLDEFEKRFGKS